MEVRERDSIKAFMRTLVCGLFDLEVGANKGNPTLEPYNDLFFYFAKFWEIILKAYLGSKGLDAAQLVEKNTYLGAPYSTQLEYYNLNEAPQSKHEDHLAALQVWDDHLWKICMSRCPRQIP
jgi:hypothetical protein